MANKAVIYDPSKSPHRPLTSLSVPIESLSSPIRFPRPVNRVGLKKSNSGIEPLETKGAWVYPGANFNIPDDDFEYISKHPMGIELINSGALRVVEPTLTDGKIQTETTVDYSDRDALEIIRHSYDIDWLERSIRKEERPVISKALIERVKGIKAVNNANRA